ncbi:hypothetical protein D3C75_814720 [compost metagenome]
MAGQGEGAGPTGPDDGHGLRLGLALGHQQQGRYQPGAAAPSVTVNGQVPALAQQGEQLRQHGRPGLLEGFIGGLIVRYGQVEPGHAPGPDQ